MKKEKRIFSKKSIRRKKSGKQKAVILLSCLLLFVAAVVLTVVLLSGKGETLPEQDIVESVTIVASDAAKDYSYLQQEAKISNKRINAPAFCGNKIAYSSTDALSKYKKLYVYDMETETSLELSVKVKYDHIIGICMSENYVAYLDASEKGGGRICVYSLLEGDYYVVKEYAYSSPKLSVEGEYLCFMQQAGDKLERLYIYNMATKESMAAKILEDNPAISGGVQLKDDLLIYSVAYTEKDVLKSRVVQLNVKTGQEVSHEWGRYVYSPKQGSGYIAFSSSFTGMIDDVYLSKDGVTPGLMIEDVTNYEMGDGFLAYTKGDNVYIYAFDTGKVYRLNTVYSKGLLAGVSGNEVYWYDVTADETVDIVKYAVIDW